MVKIKLLISIYLFLLLLSLSVGVATYCFFGAEIAKKTFAVVLLLQTFFELYLFFFDKGD